MQTVALAMDRAIARALADSRRGVSSLAAIAGTAPLFGLLASVEGVSGSLLCKGERWTCVPLMAAVWAKSLYPCAWGLILGIAALASYHCLRAQGEALEVELRDAAASLGETLRRHRP